MNQDDYENALKDFNSALQLNPDIAEAYSNIGLIYYQKREYDKAVNAFTKALEFPELGSKFKSISQGWLRKSEEELHREKQKP